MKSPKWLIGLLRIPQPLPGASCLILALILLCSIIPRFSKAEQLDIDPEVQSSSAWCWLAVGKMVFQYYDIEGVDPLNYQCGIVGLGTFGSVDEVCMSDCGYCSIPAGNSTQMKDMLEEYPKRVAYWTGDRTPKIRADARRSAASARQVKSDIDDERPIVAEISPVGRPIGVDRVPLHAVLIVGYEEGHRTYRLLVNDPYPYGAVGWNPYEAAGGESVGDGSHWIDYKRFKEELNWTRTFRVQKKGYHQPPSSYCCDNYGWRRCKASADSGDVGSPCVCAGIPEEGGICRDGFYPVFTDG
jgi:hypothetical protein